ncbi:MAG: DNRLRE domain-containing protein, partial [Planctomycetales bacterium]|nr:DNRLRE domain-containing protein [Planctomycetales bacterium]
PRSPLSPYSALFRSLAAVPSGWASASLGCRAVQDASVSELSPSTNDNSSYLGVAEHAYGSKTNALLQFDLSQYAGKVPTAATLQLTADYLTGSSVDLSIASHADLWGLTPESGWDETSVTWNDYAAGLQAGFGASIANWTMTSTGPTSVDVTEPVQRALVLGDSNLNADLDFAGPSGDVEAFYQAVIDFAGYSALYGGQELAALQSGLVYRNDANLDDMVDAADAPIYFQRLGVSQGDFNLDGVVDIRDYAVWSENFDNPSSLFAMGDGDVDGWIDTDDYDLWNASLGATNTAPADPLALFELSAGNNQEVYFQSSESISSPPELVVDFAPDLRITGFTADGADLQVTYDVAFEDASDVEVRIYQVAGGVQSLLTTATGLTGVIGQSHLATIAPNFTIANPEQGVQLLAKISSSNGLTTSRLLDSGVFADASDAWFVFGSELADTIDVSDAAIDLNATSVSLSGASPTALYVFAGEGDDAVSATPTDGFGTSLDGGTGDDDFTIEAASTTGASVTVRDAAGIDSLDITAWDNGVSTSSPVNLASKSAQTLTSSTAAVVNLTLGGVYTVELLPGVSGDSISGPGYDAPISVSSFYDLDDGDHRLGQLSLREAIAIADAINNPFATSGETIDFDDQLFDFGPVVIDLGAAGPALGHGQLLIGSDLKIVGPGADLLTITASQQSRVFQVTSGVTAAFSGLTIADGYVVGGGGGIHNRGNLTLQQVTFLNNSAEENSSALYGEGGALYHYEGSLTVLGSTFEGNKAVRGGAV